MRVPLLMVAGASLLYGHDPITTKLTWSQEISRIIYKRCSHCHREGGSAMSMVSYEEARPWAKAIKEEVLSRRMPPWGAVKGFGDLADDASLTQEEITRIAQWVEGGAPEGDPQYLPTLPTLDPRQPVASGVRSRSRKKSFSRPVLLLGVIPLSDISSEKVVAQLPNGDIAPIIWLHDYKLQWKRTFILREPLLLPAGTKISAQAQLDFILRAPQHSR